jgi:uncharacterized protein (TIGR03792 family)
VTTIWSFCDILYFLSKMGWRLLNNQASNSTNHRTAQGQAIEILEFQVDPLDREHFIEIDRQIWTTALAQYPAFQHKEIWIDPQSPEIVTIVIHWSNREEWKAIEPQSLADLASQFDQKFSRPYQLVGEREYISLR